MKKKPTKIPDEILGGKLAVLEAKKELLLSKSDRTPKEDALLGQLQSTISRMRNKGF